MNNYVYYYSLKNLKNLNQVIIAYEPVWAIGTGLIPSAKELSNTFGYIYNTVKRYNESNEPIKLLYGGSVSPENAQSLMKTQYVSGLLIGGASLIAKKFIDICSTIWDKYTMQTAILTIHIILAVILIILVLVQQGKGADAGAAFGSGASSTVFGARGSATFMNKVTTVIALSFFVTSLSLAYISSNKSSGSKSLISDTVQEETIDKQEEFNKP